jgi:WD40 repeat protein
MKKLLAIMIFAFTILCAQEIVKPFLQIGHTESVDSVAISSDNRYIVSGSDDNTIKIWDLKSGKLLKRIDEGCTTLVVNNNKIFTASKDGTTKVYLLPDGKEVATLATFDDGEWVVMTPQGFLMLLKMVQSI